MKRSGWYLFVLTIGILLIVTGIYTLIQAISEGNSTAIWIRALMLIFWIGFTVSNFFLYKKAARKRKEPKQ